MAVGLLSGNFARELVLSLSAFCLASLAGAGCDRTPLGLSREQIDLIANEHGTELKSCWKARGPHGELKVKVAITTRPDGHVDSAVADGKDAAVNACLEKQIRAWKFAAAPSPTKFSLPVNFKR